MKPKKEIKKIKIQKSWPKLDKSIAREINDCIKIHTAEGGKKHGTSN